MANGWSTPNPQHQIPIPSPAQLPRPWPGLDSLTNPQGWVRLGCAGCGGKWEKRSASNSGPLAVVGLPGIGYRRCVTAAVARDDLPSTVGPASRPIKLEVNRARKTTSAGRGGQSSRGQFVLPDLPARG